MAAGFDKYFQIARCFRDEDLRSDRQPEFTQVAVLSLPKVDIEMSFVSVPEIKKVTEGLVLQLFSAYSNKKLMSMSPFPRISYMQALLKVTCLLLL